MAITHARMTTDDIVRLNRLRSLPIHRSASFAIIDRALEMTDAAVV
jgi:hypothetical protein